MNFLLYGLNDKLKQAWLQVSDSRRVLTTLSRHRSTSTRFLLTPENGADKRLGYMTISALVRMILALNAFARVLVSVLR